MYDFGFYLEHSVFFRDYLQEEFANGKTINKLTDFNDIMTKFQGSTTFAKYFQAIDVVPAQPTNYLIAFGIRFDKVCDVELDKTFPLVQDSKYDDHYRFTAATEAAANGKGVGVYIWRIGKQYRYVGETSSLKRRINQYSNITQTMVDKNYRPTNRRVNAAICNAINRESKEVSLYFYPTQNHRHDIEQYLLQFKSASIFDINDKV